MNFSFSLSIQDQRFQYDGPLYMKAHLTDHGYHFFLKGNMLEA